MLVCVCYSVIGKLANANRYPSRLSLRQQYDERTSRETDPESIATSCSVGDRTTRCCLSSSSVRINLVFVWEQQTTEIWWEVGYILSRVFNKVTNASGVLLANNPNGPKIGTPTSLQKHVQHADPSAFVSSSRRRAAGTFLRFMI